MNSGLMGAGAQNRAFGNMSISERQASACGPQSTNPMRDVSPVESALDLLSANIDVAFKEAHELAARLAPVSEGDCLGEGAGSDSCMPQVSFVESRLDTANRSIVALSDLIRNARMSLRI